MRAIDDDLCTDAIGMVHVMMRLVVCIYNFIYCSKISYFGTKSRRKRTPVQ